ncbi:hypothetical protein L9F63_019793, partial [Diploptera punctata]
VETNKLFLILYKISISVTSQGLLPLVQEKIGMKEVRLSELPCMYRVLPYRVNLIKNALQNPDSATSLEGMGYATFPLMPT